MDLVGFVDGMPDGKYAISDKATLYCINKVNDEMVARLGASVPPYFVESFMRNGDYDCPDKYRTEITRCLRSILLIFTMLSGQIIITLTLPTWCSWAARFIIKHFGNNKNKKVQFVTDVCANAKGCEAAVKSIMRAKQMRKEARA